MVPRYVHFDQGALRELLHLGNSDYTKQKAREEKSKKRKHEPAADSEECLGLPPLVSQPIGATPAVHHPAPPAPITRRDRRTKVQMIDEKRQLFSLCEGSATACDHVKMRVGKSIRGLRWCS
jgi:hypothetical protein